MQIWKNMLAMDSFKMLRKTVLDIVSIVEKLLSALLENTQ
jgi:hypothetical protein